MKPLVEPISPGQYAWMAGISVVAGGVYFWPQFLVMYAGTQGIYSLITVVLLATALEVLETSAVYRSQGETFALALGRILPVFGPVVVFPIRAALIIVLDGVILLLYVLMMKSFFYPGTPMAIIAVVILLAAGWIGMRTLSAVARSVQFWFAIILILLVLAFSLAFSHVRFYWSVVPPARFYVDPWAETVLGTWYLYANANVLSTLVTHVRWSKPWQPRRFTMAAMLGQGVVLLSLYLLDMWELGPDALSRLYWPLTYVFSLVATQAFFFQGLGIIIILIWTSSVVLYLAVHLFSVSWSVTSLFGQWPAYSRTIVLFALMVMMFLVGAVVPSMVAARHLLFNWLSPISLLLDLALVPGMWLLSRRFGKRSPGEPS